MVRLVETEDAAPDAGTTYTMAPGDVFVGEIGTAGDIDWIAVTLPAGENFRFDVTGRVRAETLDPMLALYGPNGRRLASNDDNVLTDGTFVRYIATAGTYFLAVAAADKAAGSTGPYRLTVGSPLDEDGQFQGGFGDDTIRGGPERDEIFDDGGDNLLTGGGGDDLVFGGFGRDTIQGDAGRDEVVGLDGDDIVSGGSGRDRVYGDDGNDTLSGGTGKDLVFGGDGEDLVSGGGKRDRIFAGDGADTVAGGGGNDRIEDENGADSLDGGAGRDLIRGGNGDDTLLGGAGNDRLFGDNGNDLLDGGEGADRLDGGSDDDTLTGGAGADTFVIDTRRGDIVVTDLEPGADTVEIATRLTGRGLSGAEIADLYGSVVGDATVLVFPNIGRRDATITLTFLGIEDLDTLGDAIA